MRAPQRIELQKVKEVASLLIPLRGVQLLVPNVTVAEIVPVTQVNPAESAPEWYLGTCQWREQRVPLVSFEVLNGDVKPGLHNRARFAVLNSTGLNNDLPFLAIITQGLPRLARVSEEEISTREDNEDQKPFDLMQVSWAGEEAVIPDVARMEQAILNYWNSLNN
jgi:chemosensory pili system protein ChpC